MSIKIVFRVKNPQIKAVQPARICYMLPIFCYHIHHKFALSINKLAACYLYYNVTYTLMPKGVEFDTAVCFRCILPYLYIHIHPQG